MAAISGSGSRLLSWHGWVSTIYYFTVRKYMGEYLNYVSRR